MLVFQESIVLLPGFLGERIGQREPVASLERKRAALVAAQPAAHGIFPVGGVNDDIGDAAASRLRPPGCFSCGETPDRPAQVILSLLGGLAIR